MDKRERFPERSLGGHRCKLRAGHAVDHTAFGVTWPIRALVLPRRKRGQSK
jgi:hypothetical protein